MQCYYLYNNIVDFSLSTLITDHTQYIQLNFMIPMLEFNFSIFTIVFFDHFVYIILILFTYVNLDFIVVGFLSVRG